MKEKFLAKLGNFKSTAQRVLSLKINFKELFWDKLDYFLCLSLIIFSVGAFVSSLYFQEPINSWLINLSAGLFTSLFIIFGIDFLHQKRIEDKKHKGREVAQKDLQRLANMGLSYFLFPLGALTHGIDPISPEIGINWSSTINRLSLNKALQSDFPTHVSKLTNKKLANLMSNFKMLEVEMKDDISFYADLMPPEVLGALLNVRHAFKESSISFGLWAPMLFGPGDHSVQYKILGSSIQNYAGKLDDFTDALGNWK